MNKIFSDEISKVADTVVSVSALFNCSFETAYHKYCNESLKKDANWEEVEEYINKKIKQGEELN